MITVQKTWMRPALVRAGLCAGLLQLLAACSPEQMALEEKYHPYAGSDQYPIKVSHNRAHVKPCGDWLADDQVNNDNFFLKSHGCAVQSNIAAMLARPDDVIDPEPMGPVRAALRTHAFKDAEESGTSEALPNATGGGN